MITKSFQIADGVKLHYIETDKFKTNYFSFNFVAPLSRENAHFNAMIPLILMRACEKYPSQAEIKAMEFMSSIPYIEKIVFGIGGFFEGYTKTTITINEKIHKYAEHSLALQPAPPPNYDSNYAMSKEEFFDELSKLHIEEWRKNYNLKHFGYEVLDGEQWSLELYFSNGHKPVKIHGNNAYPYNFDNLKDLIDNCAGF